MKKNPKSQKKAFYKKYKWDKWQKKIILKVIIIKIDIPDLKTTNGF